MFTLLGIVLVVVVGLVVGVVCHIAVLTAVVRREDWKAGALAGLLPPYLFYRGWKNARQLGVSGWMRLWTASSALLVVLAALLETQMG